MRLFGVELTRFRSRRAIALTLLATFLLTAFIAGSTIWETRPVSAAEMARAEALAQQEAQQPYVQRELRRCERHPERYTPDASMDCADVVLPRPEWFLFRSELSLAEERRDSGLAVVFFVCAAMIIVGTTFAGGDWSSGSMSNQLLFEPRRAKVWSAKALVVFAGALAFSLVLMALFWLALYLVAESRGIPTGATVQEQIRWMVARGVLLAAAGGLGGYALTMLFRHTVGTLAVMFAYAVGGEALTAALPVEGAGRWSLANNVFAWLRDGHRYFDESVVCPPGPGRCDMTVRMTLADGATYLGVLLGIVVVLSVLLFRRRDIP